MLIWQTVRFKLMTNKSLSSYVFILCAPIKFFLVSTIIFFGIYHFNDVFSEEIQESPEKIISEITGGILEEIKNDPDLAAGDWIKINKLVDEKVMPVIDFEKMTSMAVGKYWRTASTDQKNTLMKTFRELLVLTYSGAIRFADKSDMKI